MEYFIGAIKKYADFSGRATRQEYWMFVLFYLIFYVVLGMVDALLGTMVLALIFSLALAIPSISLAARRLHDTSRSGWWQLITIVPLIGIIVLIVFLVQDSHAANEYGESPKLS